MPAHDWAVTIGGNDIAWQQIEWTMEQFHSPSQFSITAPTNDIDLAPFIDDSAPECVIKHKGAEKFVGVVDNTRGAADPEAPAGVIVVSGRDLSARFAKDKVVDKPPLNLTSSGLVKKWCQDHGFTDLSKITATDENIGAFLGHNYNYITQKLNRYDMLFDLAELEHFVFRMHGRQPFFGPQPDPTRTISLEYQADFDAYDWNKCHTNQDVMVHVLGWGPKRKRPISVKLGSGSIILTRIDQSGKMTSLQAQRIAKRMLEEAERFMLTMDIHNVPGDPAVDDVTVAFKILGVGKGLSQEYLPGRIHHVITQDDHVMDFSLYNRPKKV